MLAVTTAACSTTKTTSTLRTSVEPTTQRFRLVRPDADALSAEWQQDGHRILGKLSFTAACQTETTQVTRREQVKETRANGAYTATAYVLGGVLSAAGVGLYAASAGQDDTVSCGDGGNVEEGDKCNSPAGIFREVGAVTIGLGITSIIAGVIAGLRKPTTETVELPSETRATVAPAVHSCGELSQLAGLTVTAALSDGGKWSGSADENGNISIDLSPNLHLHGGVTARLSIESVPAKASRFIKPGAVLGDLSLGAVR
ncbi:MAG TPA: hypothetical protein VM686_20875 [Polyangiaceae bacterium]|nr:hypothetical protein [Polyangiaceae bacterium]